MIRRCDTDSAIDDQENQRRTFDCDLGLFEDSNGDFGFFARNDAAGIDNFVGTAVPIQIAIDAVARDARLVRDNRPSLAYKTVEQGGLPDVGPSDNGDEG